MGANAMARVAAILCCLVFLTFFVPFCLGASVQAEVADEAVSGLMTSRVYYGPYEGAVIIGCMEQGTQVEILKESGDYYKINCYDMNGYIPKSQIEFRENDKSYVNCQEGSDHTIYLPTVSLEQALEQRNALKETGKKYLGVPYVWGGGSPKGFDCSGYTQYVFNKCGMTIHRTAYLQMQDGVIVAREDLRCGDLVFFSNTGGRGFGSHVGIYLGNGQFMHSGSSTGVTISSLDSGYFNSHYQCARRVVLSELSVTAAIPDAGMLFESDISDWRQ